MRSLFVRAIDAIRVWIGLNDPAENDAQPAHGWLLPSSSAMRALALERVLTLAPVPVVANRSGGRR